VCILNCRFVGTAIKSQQISSRTMKIIKILKHYQINNVFSLLYLLLLFIDAPPPYNVFNRTISSLTKKKAKHRQHIFQYLCFTFLSSTSCSKKIMFCFSSFFTTLPSFVANFHASMICFTCLYFTSCSY